MAQATPVWKGSEILTVDLDYVEDRKPDSERKYLVKATTELGVSYVPQEATTLVVVITIA